MRKLLLFLLETTTTKLTRKPGEKAPVSGIYRFNKEYIALTKGERFPPIVDGVWRLVVSV